MNKIIVANDRIHKIYGKIELNLALSYAIKIDAKSVKSIESILSKKLYLVVANTTTSTLFNNHENIRGSDYYK
jgi:cell division GTPase FtsZ